MTSLRVLTLGQFRLEHDERLLADAAWPTVKTRQLFQALLTYRGQWVAKDRLLEWLWPALPPEAARNNLYVHLSYLRRVLEPDLPPRHPSAFVETGPDAYRLISSPALWVDADAFLMEVLASRQARQAGHLDQALARGEAALALYRGDYLPDVPYEDWAIGHREWLRETWLNLLEELAELQGLRGHYRQALDLAQRALAADPLREDLWRQAMAALAQLGDRAGALAAYQRCCTILAQELELEPAPETQRLAEAIRNLEGEEWKGEKAKREKGKKAKRGEGQREPFSLFPLSPFHLSFYPASLPFAGRGEALSALMRAWDQVRSGHGVCVLVSGEVGIGKTRLIQEFLLASRLPPCLKATCQRLTSRLPYYPLQQALTTWVERTSQEKPYGLPAIRRSLGVWGPTLAAWLPTLAGRLSDLPRAPELPPALAQARLQEALVAWISNLADETPLILFLDDLHWADRDTLAVLESLAWHLTDRPLLLLLTCRPEALAPGHPVTALVATLRRADALTQVRLSRLPVEAVEGMISQLAGEPAGVAHFVQRLYAEVEGHPLFLLETLRGLFDRGWLYLDEAGRWVTKRYLAETAYETLPLPDSLRQAILERIGELDEIARHVLTTAAVVGEPVRPELLRHLGQWPVPAVVNALEDLARRRLLEPLEDSYAFSHDWIARVVYEELPLPTRMLLHQQMAQVLEVQGPMGRPRPAVLARHWEQGGRPAWAACYWLEAGDEAARAYANGEAVRAYETAARLLEQVENPTWAARAWLRAGTIHAEVIHRYPQAEAAYTRALALAEAAGEARLQTEARLGLAWTWQRKGQALEVEAVYREALAEARRLGDEALAVRASLGLAESLEFLHGNVPEGWGLVRAALDLACRAGDALSEGLAHWRLANLHSLAQDYASALAAMGQALTCFHRAGRPEWEALAHNNLAHLHRLLGNVAAAQHAVEAGMALARRTSNAWALGYLHLTRAETALDRGDLVLVQQEVETAQLLARRLDHAHLQIIALKVLAQREATVGDLAAACQHCEEALRLAEEQAPHTLPDLYADLSDFRRRLGHRTEARQALARGLCLARTRHDHQSLARLRRLAEVLGRSS